MFPDQPGTRDALRPRKVDVLFILHFHHRGPADPDLVAHRGRPQHDRAGCHLLQRCQGITRLSDKRQWVTRKIVQIRVTSDRVDRHSERLPLRAERRLGIDENGQKDSSEPEVRHRTPGDPRHRGEVVGESIGAKPGVKPEWNAQTDGNRDRAQPQPDRLGQEVHYERIHVCTGIDHPRLPQIEGEHVSHELEILLERRLCQAELFSDRLILVGRLRVGLTHEYRRRVNRPHEDCKPGETRSEPNYRKRQCKPLRQVSKSSHRVCQRVVVGRRHSAPCRVQTESMSSRRVVSYREIVISLYVLSPCTPGGV